MMSFKPAKNSSSSNAKKELPYQQAMSLTWWETISKSLQHHRDSNILFLSLCSLFSLLCLILLYLSLSWYLVDMLTSNLSLTLFSFSYLNLAEGGIKRSVHDDFGLHSHAPATVGALACRVSKGLSCPFPCRALALPCIFPCIALNRHCMPLPLIALPWNCLALPFMSCHFMP